MSSVPPGAVQPGTVVVDRYRLDAPTSTDLADAIAWAGVDTILDRAVRVTLVSGTHAAGALDAARRAALLSDPRLSRVLDVGTDVISGIDVAYVVTEPYTGSTLTEIVSSGLVDAQQARAVVGEAAAALDVAAQRGVHHLALRPDAIRVDGHRVVVTGLGIDAGLAGVEVPGIDGAASDARDLAALAYYALTARWAGDSLDEPWLSPETIRPLPAQVDATGTPVALSTLVPHVDPVLDAVVHKTLSGAADAPASPGALAAALTPWGEVSVVASLPSFVQPPAGGVPPRQSVRSEGTGSPERRPTGRIARAASIPAAGAAGYAAGAAASAAGVGVPGGAVPPVPPPPPAAYPAAAYPGAAAAYPPAVQPGVRPATAPPGAWTPDAQPYAQPAQQTAYVPPANVPGGYAPGQYAAQPATGSVPGAIPPGTGFATEQAPRRRGVNPTPIVLGLVLVGVILGAGWAITNALRPVGGTEAGPTSVATSPGADKSPGKEASPTPEEPEVKLPVIAGAAQVGPAAACRGEQPEAAPLAVDGDPSTFWFTCTYANPQFGGLKDGVGFAVTLREAAPVNSISIMTNSTGGHVQVRKTTVDKPTEGDVLAEGAFGPTTELKFAQPVVGDSFVLWITELPQSAGKNRLELVEITVQ